MLIRQFSILGDMSAEEMARMTNGTNCDAMKIEVTIPLESKSRFDFFRKKILLFWLKWELEPASMKRSGWDIQIDLFRCLGISW